MVPDWGTQSEGGVSMLFVKRLGRFFFLECAVFEHGVDDVAAAAGQADDDAVVFLSVPVSCRSSPWKPGGGSWRSRRI